MRKQTTETASASRPEWDTLEHWLRDRMQDLAQHVLEEEVTEFLGRTKSARRSHTDNDSGYRNGLRETQEADSQFGNDTGEQAQGQKHRREV